MKKIMFNDKFGLTKSVLEGRKTMTRRIAEKVLVEDIDQHLVWTGEFKKPKYKVGEVVAVAQSYSDACLNWINMLKYKGEPGWKNKMFVRTDLMPHHIRITNVRVEQLQDISDEDCIREGILEDCPGVQYSFPTEIGYCGQYPFGSARSAFAALIDKVSGKGTWASNPWVFVYEFELVK